MQITLYSSNKGSDKISILIVYIDDIILIGDDVEKMKVHCAKEFGVKDLGQFYYFPGIKWPGQINTFASHRVSVSMIS